MTHDLQFTLLTRELERIFILSWKWSRVVCFKDGDVALGSIKNIAFLD
jgi:hypothetical protein